MSEEGVAPSRSAHIELVNRFLRWTCIFMVTPLPQRRSLHEGSHPYYLFGLLDKTSPNECLDDDEPQYVWSPLSLQMHNCWGLMPSQQGNFSCWVHTVCQKSLNSSYFLSKFLVSIMLNGTQPQKNESLLIISNTFLFEVIKCHDDVKVIEYCFFVIDWTFFLPVANICFGDQTIINPNQIDSFGTFCIYFL